jgi:hypothetical protein
MPETWDEALVSLKDVRRRLDDLEFQVHLLLAQCSSSDTCEVCGRRLGAVMRAGPSDCTDPLCPFRPTVA